MFFYKPETYHLQNPLKQSVPVLISSPHSGQFYPQDLLNLTRLPLHELRKSEDSHVDRLFIKAPALGASLLSAIVARIFCDLNRHAWDLDATMYKQPLPKALTQRSNQVKNGIGTVHKINNSGKLIFKYYLSFPMIQQFIQTYWFSYHQQITKFIQKSCQLFGGCIILDVHSMPSPRVRTAAYADIILGDGFSQTCSPWMINQSVAFFKSKNLQVKKNTPYSGGFITRNYGNPLKNIHTMQIEINKSLYMNEETFEIHDNFLSIQNLLTEYMVWLFDHWQNII